MRGTLAACVAKIVKEDRLSYPTNDGSVVLREKDVMKVGLSTLATDAVALRLDRIGNLSVLIVNRVDERVCVLFVELAKTLSETKGRKYDQLRRSMPLLRYLCAVCAIECGGDLGGFSVRYVLVAAKGTEKLDKQPIRAVRQLPTVEYEGITIARRIVSSTVAFEQLWSIQ